MKNICSTTAWSSSGLFFLISSKYVRSSGDISPFTKRSTASISKVSSIITSFYTGQKTVFLASQGIYTSVFSHYLHLYIQNLQQSAAFAFYECNKLLTGFYRVHRSLTSLFPLA